MFSPGSLSSDLGTFHLFIALTNQPAGSKLTSMVERIISMVEGTIIGSLVGYFGSWMVFLFLLCVCGPLYEWYLHKQSHHGCAAVTGDDTCPGMPRTGP